MLRRLLRWIRGRKTPAHLPKGIYVPGHSYGAFIGTFTFPEPIQINDGEEARLTYTVSRDHGSQRVSVSDCRFTVRGQEFEGQWTPASEAGSGS